LTDLVKEMFMAGECYALSADLVDYVARYPTILGHVNGAEDKQVAKWMRLHPNATAINWVTERCWIYDHPKAGTTYSHGFLFPDEVERVKLEGKRGMTQEEKTRRGGEYAQSYSSVRKWKQEYEVPVKSMTMEEEVEALVEGGGRWGDMGWTEALTEKDLVKLDRVWFEANDERIKQDYSASLLIGAPDKQESATNTK
jgi:hypothetical protein